MKKLPVLKRKEIIAVLLIFSYMIVFLLVSYSIIAPYYRYFSATLVAVLIMAFFTPLHLLLGYMIIISDKLGWCKNLKKALPSGN